MFYVREDLIPFDGLVAHQTFSFKIKQLPPRCTRSFHGKFLTHTNAPLDDKILSYVLLNSCNFTNRMYRIITIGAFIPNDILTHQKG